METLDQAKKYRNNLAKKLKQQQLLTNNKITKVFIKKSPEDMLNKEKSEPIYQEAESIVREHHKQAQAEIERQKRIQEAKRGLNERVMYYVQDAKRPLEEIKKDFYGKFIKGDKSFQVSTYINHENLLKNSNEFSPEEKDLLIEIAGNCGINGLKLLSIYAKQGNTLAEKQIKKILAEAMEHIRKFEPKNIDRNKNGAIYYYPIPKIKEEIDKVIESGGGEYIEETIKSQEHNGFIILSLADGGVTPTEEQIKTIEIYKDYDNSIVKNLLENGKLKEALLLNTKNRENRWNFRTIKENFENNNNDLTDEEFIKTIVKNECGGIILADYVKLELTTNQEEKLIQTMSIEGSAELSGETLERASLMHPRIFGENTNTNIAKIPDEEKKLLSRDDLWKLLEKNNIDKGLSNALKDYGNNNDNLQYLLENGYVSACIDLFLKTSEIEKVSPEIIDTLLNKIINWKSNPFNINPYHMERYGLESNANISRYHSLFFNSLPYNIGIFLKCVDKLTNEQLTKIKPLLDKVIMENDFRGTFAVDIGGYSFNVIKSGFLNNNLYRLIRGRFISEESLEKLRKDSRSGSNAVDFRLRDSILFEEWNPVANPHPENPTRNKLWNKLPNNSIYNKNKQVIVDNIQITTTTNYRGETIPALRVFGKTISFLTYHTKDENICYEKDGRYYINKDHAEEVAKAQDKKILDNIEIPAEYGYEYQAMVRGTYYLGHDDIISLLGEYAPYCTIKYHFPDKVSTYQDGFKAKGEQFSPVVVYE